MTDLAPAHLVQAASYIGFHEVGNNRGIEYFIEDAHTGSLGDAWCSIFVNACLEEVGLLGTRSARARSFENHPNFVKLEQPTLGCVVTRWRGSPTAGTGHVYFYCGENDNGIIAIAGNEGDAVRRYYEPLSPITGYWWPKSLPVPEVNRPRLPEATALDHAAWETQVVKPDAPPAPSANAIVFAGKMSTFGGPDDNGMAPHEGLALFETEQAMIDAGLGDYILPPNGYGLGRRLNPDKFYVACRWDYAETPKRVLRAARVRVDANGHTAFARPVDWGPNVNTGRACDLSPGLAQILGLKTGDEVSITLNPESPVTTQSTLPAPTSATPPFNLDQAAIDKIAEFVAERAEARIEERLSDPAIKQKGEQMGAAVIAKIIGLVFSAAGAGQVGMWGAFALQLLQAATAGATVAVPTDATTLTHGLLTLAGSGIVQLLNRLTQKGTTADGSK